MTNYSHLNTLYLKGQPIIAEYFGQVCSTGRPDYSVVDNTPVTVITQRKLKLEKVNRLLVHPDVRLVEFYASIGKRSGMSPGDIIFPSNLPFEGGSTTPPITIVNISPVEDVIGIRTDRVCSISNGSTEIFTNVRYSVIGNLFTEGPIANRNQLATSDVPTRRIVMYQRNLANLTRDSEGLIITETDSVEQSRWNVLQADLVGNVEVILLDKAIVN